MRGAHKHLGEGGRIDGIIPAYAGSTSYVIARPQPSRDHPRVCGEHASSNLSATKGAGSSPRMRGALPDSFSAIFGAGIIPAYAGSTPLPPKPFTPARDHPRVCGEHVGSQFLGKIVEGSSPRMRGAPCLYDSAVPVPKDHPRVCGEHAVHSMLMSTNAGSSPRMRGAPRRRVRAQVQDGIIPAYAGSTSSTFARIGSARDHPRVCGEHGVALKICRAVEGSSPRMRGAPDTGTYIDRMGGIIPAYAGSTTTAT